MFFEKNVDTVLKLFNPSSLPVSLNPLPDTRDDLRNKL